MIFETHDFGTSARQAREETATTDEINELIERISMLFAESPSNSETLPLDAQSLDTQGLRIGHYEVIRCVGAGAFGIVYQAYDPHLDRDVAVKVPRLDVVLDPMKLSCFHAEAKTAAKLDHPGIVTVYEAELIGPTPYIATAFCHGPDLATFLANQSQPIATEQAVDLMIDLSAAVAHAHENGVVHRDIKPSNVMLLPRQSIADVTSETSPSLADFQPCLTDFGFVLLLEESMGETSSNRRVGTPLYMAPEQAQCHSCEIGPATDVFALGALLYELLTGESPFAAKSLSGVLRRLANDDVDCVRNRRAEISEDLEQICMNCLAARPADRPPNAGILLAELTKIRDGRPTNLKAKKRLRRWLSHPARRQDACVLIAVMALVRIGFVSGCLPLLLILKESPPTAIEVAQGLVILALTTVLADATMIYAAGQHYLERLSSRALSWVTKYSAAWTIYSAAITSGILVPVQYGDRFPAARVGVFTFVTILFFAQTVCWLVAKMRR